MTKEINATAPTPQDWIDLVRENERLTKQLEFAESLMTDAEYSYYLDNMPGADNHTITD